MAANDSTLSQERVREVLRYDPETGHFFWRAPNGKVKAGQRAGSVHKAQKYRLISFDGSTYKEHRLAWLYVHGRVPEQIDHINRVRDDNRIANLRASDLVPNRQNTLGKGITYREQVGKWQAQIGVFRKSFSLGYYSTEKDAMDAYLLAKWVLHPSFRASVCDSYASRLRQQISKETQKALNVVFLKAKKWSERRDSNSRPPQPH